MWKPSNGDWFIFQRYSDYAVNGLRHIVDLIEVYDQGFIATTTGWILMSSSDIHRSIKSVGDIDKVDHIDIRTIQSHYYKYKEVCHIERDEGEENLAMMVLLGKPFTDYRLDANRHNQLVHRPSSNKLG